MKTKFLAFVLCLSLLPVCSAMADQTATIRTDDETVTEKKDVVKEKTDNPVIDIPVGTLEVMYGGFQGFGVLFDDFITGDKPPKKALKFKDDPLPITRFQDRYEQLMQFDYGVKSINDFATTNQKENLSTKPKQ